MNLSEMLKNLDLILGFAPPGTQKFEHNEAIKKLIKKYFTEAIESLRLENKYNLITEKRRLTYGDVDEAFNKAVKLNNSNIDKLLK